MTHTPTPLFRPGPIEVRSLNRRHKSERRAPNKLSRGTPTLSAARFHGHSTACTFCIHRELK